MLLNGSDDRPLALTLQIVIVLIAVRVVALATADSVSSCCDFVGRFRPETKWLIGDPSNYDSKVGLTLLDSINN